MRYLLRRLGFFVLTLWAALTINFLIPRLMPGDPATAILARFHGRLSLSALHAIEDSLGIQTTQNIWVQYVTYIGNTLRLNFGDSIQTLQPVSQVVGAAIPWTLTLVGVTTILAFCLGTGIGALAAWRRGSKADSILPPLFVVGTGLPYFWVGMMLIILFAEVNPWLPVALGIDPGITPGLSGEFIGSALRHAILPAAAILITSIGGWVLTMRNTMVTTLAEDYIRMARAKGLSSGRIMWDYAARNSILPNLTGFAMSLGFVVSGSVLVEDVFNYPGVGFQLVQAVENEDFPLMQCLFLLITVAVLVAVLLADIATALLDPRTRSAR
ncbi:MAG TPA: ABC transporter permease [Pseudonocardiaceae bacterium]|nr:ABC transporter permease [Pseudonocardiaceae bacterium]